MFSQLQYISNTHTHTRSPRFTEHELPTRMGRGLLLARLGNGMNVATVHLESLDSPRMRQRQLEEIAGVFDALDARDSILVGDFNFDSSQTWGDWNRKQRTPQGELENNVLNSVLPGWHDLWATLQPGDDGFTFDGIYATHTQHTYTYTHKIQNI